MDNARPCKCWMSRFPSCLHDNAVVSCQKKTPSIDILTVVSSAGYPILTWVAMIRRPKTTLGAYNLGGVNSSGQIPEMHGRWTLIDKDTPSEVYTRTSYHDGKELQLVFSDEFNIDGRSFYPGDDPYWEAVDIWYW